MLPISGRLRAASWNWRLSSPSSSTLRLPLRSWSRKLKPAEAPKPLMLGMLKGKMMASGMAANERIKRAITPVTCAASPCLSSQGLSRTKTVPKLGWKVLVTAPRPPMVWKESTSSSPRTSSSTCLSTASVRSSEAPGGSVMLMPKMPWSSSGMKPARSAPPKKPAPTATTTTTAMVRNERRTSMRAP